MDFDAYKSAPVFKSSLGYN